MEKPPYEGPLVDVKRLKTLVFYPVLAAAALAAVYLWLGPAFYGLTVARERRSELAPLLEKARELGLKYEAASSGPAGTPVFWCVQNRDEWNVTVEGDTAKRIKVSNYPAMPRFTGSKHEPCSPMLLILEKPEAGEKVRVFFKEAPEIR